MATRSCFVAFVFAAIAVFCMIIYWPKRAEFKAENLSPVFRPYSRSKATHAKEYSPLAFGRRSVPKQAKEGKPPTLGRRSMSKQAKEDKPPTLGRRSMSKQAKEDNPPTLGRRSMSKQAKEDKPPALGRRSMSKQAEEDILRLPDVKHPIVKISSIANLRLMEQLDGHPLYKSKKRPRIVGTSNRTIVLRFRANTSTFAEPAPDAGNLSAILMGRTGNRMTIYAGLYGIARRNGMHHVISSKNPLLKLFKLNATVVDSDRPGRDWVQYVVKTKTYDSRTEYLDPRINVELVGYCGHWKYIANVMQDLLKHHFRLRDDIQRQADNFLLRSMAKFALTSSDVALIGIHIRRTDLLARREREGRLAQTPSVSYYRHAAAFFNRLFYNQTMYVVCSDDIEWAKANIVLNRPVVFSAGNSADVDFAILASCNHSIISMGTFSRWSAIVTGGVTIRYSPKAPTQVPLSAARKRLGPTENPMNAWVTLS